MMRRELQATAKALLSRADGVNPIGGLSASGLSLAVGSLHRAKSQTLVIVSGPETSEDIALDLRHLAPDLPTLTAPVLDENNPEKDAHWTVFLSQLRGFEGLVLAPVGALLEPLPQPDAWKDAHTALVPGDQIDLGKFFQRLVDCGYSRVDQVLEPGEFARRGGIVDLFPTTLQNPIRIELFGDDIESVRLFDVESQRSFESLPDGTSLPLLQSESDDREASLFDHLAPSTTLTIQPDACLDRIGTLISFRPDDDRSAAVRDAIERSRHLTDYDQESSVRCIKPESLGVGFEGAAKLIDAMRQASIHAFLFCGAEPEVVHARKGLSNFGVAPGDVTLLEGDLGGSRVLPDLGVCLLSLHELSGRARRKNYDTSDEDHSAAEVMDDFLQVEEGDHVVHLQHGIAIFRGMETLERDGTSGEFLALEFADGLILHVPASNADVVQKYIGSRGHAPRLSTYNTRQWTERKLRAQQAVLKLATEMLQVQAVRSKEAGHQCDVDNTDYLDFQGACPFRDTPDQEKVSRQIHGDLESARPMDRLICGDVGYGKTELAMRAAYRMVTEGKQVAVLVPTTVLAQQHWLSFRDRLAGFPVMVETLSRFRTPKEQRETVERLAEGKVDIVIGTHRLLSKDIQFKDLGLLVIDEEQRFGVEHKERLKRLRSTVDILTLSATPIPRTLHQSMLGLRDISSLTTPPEHRLAVKTSLMHWEDDKVANIIRYELARDGQVYFVHNRVYDIEEFANRVRQVVPEARIEIGHGQMPEGELEGVMQRFMAGEIDVLVSTTIIESGIDVRKANTILIDRAHHFGLSDLHQLRGRVGRYHHQAYCYLLVPEDTSVPELSQQRLKAILQYSALGSGFKIAMRDLELRGAGNLLGPEQSGHISNIGYDLYCRLLERAVRRLQNREVPPEVDTQLDLGLDLRIPKRYVSGTRQRLEIYRKLARVHDHTSAEAFENELADRFGKPPRILKTMVQVAIVRNRLAKLGVTSLIQADGHLRLKALNAPMASRKLQAATRSFRVLDETTLALPLHKSLQRPEDQLRFLYNLLQTLATKTQPTN